MKDEVLSGKLKIEKLSYQLLFKSINYLSPEKSIGHFRVFYCLFFIFLEEE